ncbi:MAG: arsenical efflux pump membrane protein ArsB [Firmicutes bacterium]|nr:arsenical efflux pump membrane protein ArsB [Bacillota bacterium]
MAAVIVTSGTVWGVLRRPRGLGPGAVAWLGAALMLSLGLVRPADVVAVFRLTWDATLALIGMVLTAEILDQARFFRAGALFVARAARGRPAALFFGLTLLTAAVAAFFTNDAAVLILTPIACELAAAFGWSAAQALPLLFAVGFVADTFSLPFTTSNLVNIMSADAARLPFGAYARAMAVPSAVSLAVSLAVLWWRFGGRSGHARPFAPGAGVPLPPLPAPGAAVRDRVLVAAGAVVLILEMVCLFWASRHRVPTAAIVGGGALLLALLAAWRPGVSVRGALLRAPWQVIFFAAGMFLVVDGLGRAGWAQLWARNLEIWAAHP